MAIVSRREVRVWWSSDGRLTLGIHVWASSKPSFRGAKTFEDVCDSLFYLAPYLRPLRGSAWKAKRLSSVWLSLLKACSGMLARTEEKYPVPGFYVDFAKKEWKAQLNGLFTRKRPRGLMHEKLLCCWCGASVCRGVYWQSLDFRGEMRLDSGEPVIH